MSAEMHLPSLYRSILKAAVRFPSIRRAAMITEIKNEFHANKVRHQLDCLYDPSPGSWQGH